jgi:hypothetical protein
MRSLLNKFQNESKSQVLDEENLSEIGVRLVYSLSLEITQMLCTKCWDFKTVSTKSHKAPKTKNIQDNSSA